MGQKNSKTKQFIIKSKSKNDKNDTNDIDDEFIIEKKNFDDPELELECEMKLKEVIDFSTKYIREKTPIFILGKSKTGKTTFCEKEFRIEINEREIRDHYSPTTSKIKEYNNEKNYFKIFDSIGFTLLNYEKKCKEYYRFIEKNKITIVLLMVNAKDVLEEAYFNIYKNLLREFKKKNRGDVVKNLYFIFTKCDLITEKESIELREKCVVNGIPIDNVFFIHKFDENYQKFYGPDLICKESLNCKSEGKFERNGSKKEYFCTECMCELECECCKGKEFENEVVDDVVKYKCISCGFKVDALLSKKCEIEKFRIILVKNAIPRDQLNLLQALYSQNKSLKWSLAWRIPITFLIYATALGVNCSLAASPIPWDFVTLSAVEGISVGTLATVWDTFSMWDRDRNEVMKLLFKKIAWSIGSPFLLGLVVKGISTLIKGIVVLDPIFIPIDIVLSGIITLLILMISTTVFVTLYVVITPDVFKKLNKEKKEKVLDFVVKKAAKKIGLTAVYNVMKVVLTKRTEIYHNEEEFLNLFDFYDEEFEKEINDLKLDCSISTEIMKDPVTVIESNQTYERSYIEEWFKRNDTDPNTNVKLKSKELKSNKKKKKLIDFWMEKKTLELNSDKHFGTQIV